MLKEVLIAIIIFLTLSGSALSSSEEREFIIDDSGDTSVIRIESINAASSMKIEVNGMDFEGEREENEKVFFKFSVPKNVYAEFENADTFLDNIYVFEDVQEVNILRSSRENSNIDKSALSPIKNYISEEYSDSDSHNEDVKAEEFRKEEYYNSENVNIIKKNPFLTSGIFLIAAGTIVNIKSRWKS